MFVLRIEYSRSKGTIKKMCGNPRRKVIPRRTIIKKYKTPKREVSPTWKNQLDWLV
jgi:hypothetical protein